MKLARRVPVLALVLFGTFLVFAPYVNVSHAVATPTALLVQDEPPWCTSTANQAALTADGISYTVVSSSTFVGMNEGQLLKYHEIIFAGDQLGSFQTTLSTLLVKTELMVLLSAGVNLVVHAIDSGWQCSDASSPVWSGSYLFPTVMTTIGHVQDYDYTDHVVGTGAVVSGVTSTITGNFASHDYFTGLPTGASVQIENSNDKPTYFTWTLGRGTLYASTMTLEFFGGGAGPYQTLLRNEFRLANA